MYHDVAAARERESVGFPGPLAARYKLDPAHFERHLDTIAETGLAVGTLDGGGSPPAVAITFDDGGASAPLAASCSSAAAGAGSSSSPRRASARPASCRPRRSASCAGGDT